MKTIGSAIYEPSLGDRIRILVEHNGSWKALFWIKLAKDGSIYLSPRITNPRKIKHGKSKSDDKGTVSISYSEGVELENISQANKAKISFHASGVINSLSGRQLRSSLQDISKQEQICTVFFQYPERFDVISLEKLQKRDICLRYPIEDEYPIFMHIFVFPTSKLQLVDMGTDKHQVNLVLQYNNIDYIGDVSVQLSLFAPSKGPWPPYTYVIYPTNE